jgi:hypothetical protein
LRFVCYLPLVGIAALILLLTSGMNLSMVLLNCVKFLVLGLFSQPVLAIAQISPGTNDAQKPKILLAALIFLVLFIPSLITIVAATTFWVLLSASLIFAMASLGGLFLYAHFFNQNSFDLVPMQAHPAALR